MVMLNWLGDKGEKRPPIYTNYFAGCNHWRQPVRVGRYTVTCSSHLARKHILESPVPDFGIYLAVGWRDSLGKSWTNGSYLKRLAVERPYPALVRDWTDGGGIPARDMNQLVEICRAKMRKGKVIDIGCSAGHGRTGTLLTCLIARVEHLPADEAIRIARKRYCCHAVESAGQQESVREYIGQFGIKRRSNEGYCL